jgi:hypothetical protein
MLFFDYIVILEIVYIHFLYLLLYAFSIYISRSILHAISDYPILYILICLSFMSFINEFFCRLSIPYCFMNIYVTFPL